MGLPSVKMPFTVGPRLSSRSGVRERVLAGGGTPGIGIGRVQDRKVNSEIPFQVWRSEETLSAAICPSVTSGAEICLAIIGSSMAGIGLLFGSGQVRSGIDSGRLSQTELADLGIRDSLCA